MRTDEPSWGDEEHQGRRVAGLKGQAAYEDKAVRRVASLLGMPRVARLVADLSERRTGHGGRTFAILEEVLPTFPIRFRVGRLRWVRFITIPDMFDRFHRTPLGVAFAEVAAQLEDEDPEWDGAFGLIFQWPGVSTDTGKRHAIKGGSFMVMHTFPSGDIPGCSKLVVPTTIKSHGRKRDISVVVEKLETLMRAFDGWSPG